MSDIALRKPLDAQLVGKINADAMKALADVKKRRKWGDSNSGSPVSTNMLCAEIARLNMEMGRIIAKIDAWASDPAPGGAIDILLSVGTIARNAVANEE